MDVFAFREELMPSGRPKATSAKLEQRVTMAIRGFQRSIRFTKSEWDAAIEAAEKAGIAPGSFVRKTGTATIGTDARRVESGRFRCDDGHGES